MIKDEVKNAILSRYEGAAKEVYEDVLKALEVTIRDIYEMMSKFIHPDSDKVEFNPHMVDAVYVFRQTVDVINYLVDFHGFNAGASVVCVSVIVTCMLNSRDCADCHC